MMSGTQAVQPESLGREFEGNPFFIAALATPMPMLVTDPRRPDNPIVFVNAAFCALTGYERDDVIGRNCRFLQGPGTNRGDIARLRTAIADRQPIELDLLNYRKDGSSFWNRLVVSPVFAGDGQALYFTASQFDISPERNRLAELKKNKDQLQAEIEIRMRDIAATEARLKFILGASRMGSWTLDIASQRLDATAQCKMIFGRRPQDSFSYADLRASIHPDDLDRWQAEVGRVIDGRTELAIEYRIVTPDAQNRWVEVRGHIQAESAPLSPVMIGISQDITARKELEEQRKIMSRELVHRVKNTMAAAQSIFNHSLRNATDLQDAKHRAGGRIRALAAAQDLLILEGWTSADTKAVVAKGIAPFYGHAITFDGPDLVLDEVGVSALTLGLYELATNSIKYGALSVETGAVNIRWSIIKGQENYFMFEWQERGGPPAVKPKARGFGSTIMETVVPNQFRGSSEMLFEDAGLTYRITAPVPHVPVR